MTSPMAASLRHAALRLLARRYRWPFAAAIASSVVGAILATLFTVVLSDGLAPPAASERLSYVLARGSVAPIATALIVGVAAAAEFRHGTIAVAALVIPSRRRLLGAALIAAAAAGTAAGALSAGIVLLLSPAVTALAQPGVAAASAITPGQATALVLIHAALTATCAITATAIAWTLRSVAGTALLILGWPLVADPLLAGLLRLSPATAPAASYLPFAAGGTVAETIATAERVILAPAPDLPPVAAALIVAGIAAGASIAAIADYVRRGPG